MISCIYKIENKINMHIYIGSAVDVTTRWSQHIHYLRKGKHHSRHLQNAWNKYGEDSFEFCILEKCSKGKLIKREQFYIDTLNPEYNIARVAGSPLGVKHTDEAKKKMSLAKKGRKGSRPSELAISLLIERNKNRIWSQESKDKLSKARKEKYGEALSILNKERVWTKEMRDKLSKSKRRLNDRLSKTEEAG